MRQTAKPLSSRPAWNTPVWLIGLSVVGLAISVYLWSAKAGSTAFICGAIGDCVSVNTSAYSEIAGIPVAAAGTAMYAGLFGLGLWVRRRFASLVVGAGFLLSLAGALFSLYLTAIEAFVLRAYCVWCLISWILVTALAAFWGKAFTSMPSEEETEA